MSNHEFSPQGATRDFKGSKQLDADQVRMIEKALADVGDYGEVRLVVEKGKLRFLVLQRSLDFLKESAVKALG